MCNVSCPWRELDLLINTKQVLQFGYISMFFVVFPLAPLFAILNNVWEFKLDLSKLVKTRRPQVGAVER